MKRIMQMSHQPTPAALSPVPAGDPSHSYADVEWVDLNSALASGDCLLLKVRGDSMHPQIPDGALVIADREKVPKDGDTVVAIVPEGFTVKTFRSRPLLQLVPKNKNFSTILPEDVHIIGVIRYIITVPVLLGLSFARLSAYLAF